MTARYSAPCTRPNPARAMDLFLYDWSAQWTGAHVSKSPESKTEFTGIDGLRTYIRTVPAAFPLGTSVLRRNLVQRGALWLRG